jgi:transmembrane sensor
MTFSAQSMRRIRAAADAAEWVQRLEAGVLMPAERAEFVDWLRESPVHVAEMLRARQLHSELTGFAAWEDVAQSAGVSSGRHTVVRLRSGRHNGLDRARLPSAPRRSRRATWAAAASVLLSVLAGLFLATQVRTTLLSTQNGERREVTLKDGSRISLASNTTVRYRLGAKLRSIALEGGEAQFRVAKDPSRPFVVTAAGTRIRAVGTVFNVANYGKVVVVTVTEGRVAVDPMAHPWSDPVHGSPASIALASNQQVAVNSDGRATPVHAFSGSSDRASFGTQLSFDGETVAQVVERFNAVNHVKIRITDDTLAQRRVTGVFSATDPGSFVAFLAAAAGAVPVEHFPEEIDVGASGRQGSSVSTR